MSNSSFQIFSRPVLDIMPLSIAVIPWGMLTGALAIQAGFSPLEAQLLSLLVFAGAAQLSTITLFASGAGSSAIVSSVFVISSRHLLYSVVFRQHVMQLPMRWRLALAFVLTDEMFAVSEAHTKQEGAFSAFYALISGVTFYIVWNIATLIGIVVGDQLSNLEHLGLDFAIAATFIAMTFGELRKRPILIAVLVSGVSAVLLKSFFSDTYIIIAAIAGMCVAYLCDDGGSDE